MGWAVSPSGGDRGSFQAKTEQFLFSFPSVPPWDYSRSGDVESPLTEVP